MTDLIAALRSNLAKLSAGDASFAASLLDQHARRGDLSPKQWPWVEKLVQRATAADKPREQIGDLSAIMALFKTAAASLKHPKVILALPEGIEIKLTIAGDRARHPGTINIVERDDERRFFGRIMLDGSLDARDTAPASLPGLLRDFAANPAGIAAAYGHATGCCCFCARELTDARSVAVGYGPVCAEKFDLPWGESVGLRAAA